MLQIVNGKLMNSRDVGNAVAKLLMEGMPIDMVSGIEGMPSATQIAWMRKNDPQFAEGLTVAFEGAGIEAAFVLMKGARDGAIGKNQVEAAQWVAERMAPDLFQERRTVTTQEIPLTDEELHAQLEAAARTDIRVKAWMAEQAKELGVEAMTIYAEPDKRKKPQRLKRVMKRISSSR
jgi:hypothetical protein